LVSNVISLMVTYHFPRPGAPGTNKIVLVFPLVAIGKLYGRLRQNPIATGFANLRSPSR